MKTMWFIFKSLRRSRRENTPYPKDDKMARALAASKSLEGGTTPLFALFLVRSAHFDAKSCYL